MLSTRLRLRIKLMGDHLGTSMMGNVKSTSVDFKPCPTCGAQAIYETRPFCSKRCADIDLGRWLQGAFAIPASDAADERIIDAELAKSGKMREPDLRGRHR